MIDALSGMFIPFEGRVLPCKSGDGSRGWRRENYTHAASLPPSGQAASHEGLGGSDR